MSNYEYLSLDPDHQASVDVISEVRGWNIEKTMEKAGMLLLIFRFEEIEDAIDFLFESTCTSEKMNRRSS